MQHYRLRRQFSKFRQLSVRWPWSDLRGGNFSQTLGYGEYAHLKEEEKKEEVTGCVGL